MYNKNGLIATNRYLNGATGATGSMSISSLTAGDITYEDGTTNTGGTIHLASSANITVDGFTRFYITGRNASNAMSVSSYPYNGFRINVGYREEDFTENTFTQPTTSYSSMSSITLNKGIPTLVLVNTGISDIIVNDITFAVLAGDDSSAITKHMVFAGFHFPDITIAPGDSYTFTFSHKNA